MDGPAPSLATVLRPSLGDLDQLVEALSEAESQVAQALAGLNDGWTVYVQPRLGLDQPDFVAVHDELGVCAIEVKGWLPHAVRQNDDGDFEFSGESGQWTASGEQPRFDASRYRSTIFDQFYAMPEDGDAPPPEVRAIVVLPYFTTEQATQLFERPGVHDGEELVGVWGGDALPAFDDVIRGFGCQSPRPESIDKLRSHIVASERMPVDAGAIPPLSPGVADVAENPRRLRARRVRGAAGSGKTYGLTARAARLAAEGKSVLVLSFNVTLANRLRALATERCREIGANATLITCSNFHSFCTRVVQDAEVAGHQLVSPSAPWTVAIVAKAEQAFEQGFRRRYDAVLIDEGQDFTSEWWQLLRTRVVTSDGEMLVVADPTQDLYGRYSWTADDSIGGAGFSGDWTDLESSERLPADVTSFLSDFATSHVRGERLVPRPDDRTGSSVRRWANIERVNDLGRAVGEEVVRMLRDNPTLSPGDVAFLCEYHHDGVAAVRVIEQAGIPVHHIFSRDPDAPRRRRKHRFWPGAPAVKACTTHSFKGWESPGLVVGIGADARSKPTAYVALTRLSVPGDGRPAVVSVLNANGSLAHLESAFVAGSASPAILEPVAAEAPDARSPMTPPAPPQSAPLTPPAAVAESSLAAPTPTPTAAPSNGTAPSSSGVAPSSNGVAPPSSNGAHPSSSNGVHPSSSNGVAPSSSNGVAPSSNGVAPPSSNGAHPSSSNGVAPSSNGAHPAPNGAHPSSSNGVAPSSNGAHPSSSNGVAPSSNGAHPAPVNGAPTPANGAPWTGPPVGEPSGAAPPAPPATPTIAPVPPPIAPVPAAPTSAPVEPVSGAALPAASDRDMNDPSDSPAAGTPSTAPSPAVAVPAAAAPAPPLAAAPAATAPTAPAPPAAAAPAATAPAAPAPPAAVTPAPPAAAMPAATAATAPAPPAAALPAPPLAAPVPAPPPPGPTAPPAFAPPSFAPPSPATVDAAAATTTALSTDGDANATH